jgi:hypothetical protein
MTKLYGTVINDTIVPPSTEERFPTHDAQYGKGGYRSVNTIQERDAIPTSRLTLGAEVRVMEEEDSPVYYVSSLSPLTWRKLSNKIEKAEVVTIIDELKGIPGGLATLDDSGKLTGDQLPEINIPKSIRRGTYVDDSTFNNEEGLPYVNPDKNCIYIDNSTNSMYTYNGEIFIKDSMKWIEV